MRLYRYEYESARPPRPDVWRPEDAAVFVPASKDEPYERLILIEEITDVSPTWPFLP